MNGERRSPTLQLLQKRCAWAMVLCWTCCRTPTPHTTAMLPSSKQMPKLPYQWWYIHASEELGHLTVGVACECLLPRTWRSWDQWDFTQWGRHHPCGRILIPSTRPLAEWLSACGVIPAIQSEHKDHCWKDLLKL